MITRLWTSLSLWLPLWLSISISLGILPRVEAQEEASSSQGTLAELAQSVGLGPIEGQLVLTGIQLRIQKVMTLKSPKLRATPLARFSLLI
ncbi:MAG: hypothetical protein IPK04_03080 [Bdellovibrionales bacterium]|nr:hypothetical protein [Bdellovibrionales bacterium]